MITFELNNPGTFALTGDQIRTIWFLIEEYGKDEKYEIVEGDTPGIVWLWVHDDEDTPTRYWIQADGRNDAEQVTWDWKGTTHD